VRHGGGAPPLVFVHGFACSLEDWRAQLDFFAPTHEVVACDLRAHGATPGRAQECSIEHYAGDVAALLNNLQLPPAILVGHSMGTRVVLEAARIDRERVAGLVLIDGSRQGSGNPDEAEAAMEAAIRAAGFHAFRENAFRQMFFQWSPQAEALLERSKRLAPDAGRALWTRMVRWDAEHMDAALAAVRCPLMVIQATYVNAQRRRVALEPGQTTPFLELIKQRTPGARIEVLPGVGHFAQIEAAAEVNRLVSDFIVQYAMAVPKARG
jgi:pimeloyl-ACP methyl ester carboxylesterase